MKEESTGGEATVSAPDERSPQLGGECVRRRNGAVDGGLQVDHKREIICNVDRKKKSGARGRWQTNKPTVCVVLFQLVWVVLSGNGQVRVMVMMRRRRRRRRRMMMMMMMMMLGRGGGKDGGDFE